MKLLFVFRHAGCLRVFDSTLQALDRKGHQVKIAYNLAGERVGHELTDQLLSAVGGVEIEMAPQDKSSARARQMNLYAAAADRLRYFNPAYADAPKLVARAQGRIDKLGTRVNERLKSLVRVVGWVRGLEIIRTLTEALPPSATISEYLLSEAPDLVVISPLVDFGSEQLDYLHAALAAQIPVAVCVHSWDNLTNKGLLRLVPDRVILWNPAQLKEASSMHGVPAERVGVTGAQVYDAWFEMKPILDVAGLSRLTGLDSSRPYVLYTGSSAFIGGEDEPELVRQIRAALDASPDPVTRSLQILVRPHPQNPEPFRDLDKIPGIAVWPKGGELPVHADAKTNYFDSIYHSTAVLGVNTSAMIEACIIDRPVMTVLDPRFHEVQLGTLHFKHLVEGDFMVVAHSCEALVQALVAVVNGDRSFSARNAAFVAHFIRPHGRDVRGTDLIVAELEGAAAAGALDSAVGLKEAAQRTIDANDFIADYMTWAVIGKEKSAHKKDKKLKPPKPEKFKADKYKPEKVKPKKLKADKNKLDKQTKLAAKAAAEGASDEADEDVLALDQKENRKELAEAVRLLRENSRLPATRELASYLGRAQHLLKDMKDFKKFVLKQDRGEESLEAHYAPRLEQPEDFAGKTNKYNGPIDYRSRTGADSQQYKTLARKHRFDFFYQLERMLDGDHIVVGPWSSEVGYEILYWIPFVNYLCAEGYIDPAKTCLVTRGGAAAFYASRFAHTVDIFEQIGVDDLRAAKAEAMERGDTQKQYEETILDERLVAGAIEKAGFDPAGTRVFHPKLMYNFLSAYWAGGKGAVPFGAVLDSSLAKPFELGEDPELSRRLPSEYVCIKFYFRDSFPEGAENVAFVSRIMGSISRRAPVVCLNTGMAFDDHAESRVDARERLIFVDDLMTPSNNLLVQARAIANSRCFVGTYGGLSYLPMFVGRDSFAFSASDFKLNVSHDLLAATYAKQFGRAFHHFHTGDRDNLSLIV